MHFNLTWSSENDQHGQLKWRREGDSVRRRGKKRGRRRRRELSSARCMNESRLALRMTIENRIENKIKAIKCIPISSTRHLDLALRIYSIYWKHIKTSNNNGNNKQQVDAATWSCKDVFTDFRSHKVNAAECAKRQDRVLIGNRWGCRRSCCLCGCCCCCCSWASMRLLKLLLLLLLLWRRLLSSVMTRPLHLSVCPASSVCVSLKSEATKRPLCAWFPDNSH